MSLKVCIFTPSKHAYAPLVMKAIADAIDPQNVLVLMTPKLRSKKKGRFGRAFQILRSSGADYLVSLGLMQLKLDRYSKREDRANVPAQQRRFADPPTMAKLIGFRTNGTIAINDPPAHEIIKEFAPDVIVSLFFNQIIKRETFELASEAWNVHPSLLPAYKGVSPAFWMLARGALEAGATIHRLTEKIDEGDYLFQESTPVMERDSMFTLYARCAELAGEGLRSLLVKLEAREPLNVIPEEGESSYFSTITKDAVREFRRNGRTFSRGLEY
ncbi:MAG: hypothetical protein NUW37_19665 [Planctomycetes bacterium]|nr:hypothetical protein [Planctomycetota bacterium]